jgi:hypothetical protein
MMTMERATQARGACRWIAAWLLILSFALPTAAQTSLDADAAEALVRETWYEGLPVDRAAQIGAAGADRLVTLLKDPSERAHHANILVALAACARPGAYEAMAAWALLPRTGEVDRATFRAWQALPHALGQLAGRDRRALQLLVSQLDAQPPGWRFRHHDSERIARLTRRGAASGLATSGLPEADALLRGAEARRHADPDFREHLREERRRLRERAEGSAR